MTLAHALVPRARAPRVAGDAAPWPFGAKYMQTKEYREVVANAPGSEDFWTDPLVAYLRARGFSGIVLREDRTKVGPVIDAVSKLDGLHGGQWGAVSASLEQLGDALDAWNHHPKSSSPYELDRAHIRDAIGYPVAAAYDAATALERQRAALEAHEDEPEPEPPRIRLFARPVQQDDSNGLSGGVGWVLALAAAAAVARIAGVL